MLLIKKICISNNIKIQHLIKEYLGHTFSNKFSISIHQFIFRENNFIFNWHWLAIRPCWTTKRPMITWHSPVTDGSTRIIDTKNAHRPRCSLTIWQWKGHILNLLNICLEYQSCAANHSGVNTRTRTNVNGETQMKIRNLYKAQQDQQEIVNVHFASSMKT